MEKPIDIMISAGTMVQHLQAKKLAQKTQQQSLRCVSRFLSKNIFQNKIFWSKIISAFWWLYEKRKSFPFCVADVTVTNIKFVIFY